MRRHDLPLVKHVAEAGPDDPVFDALLLSGPLVIAIVAVAGRNRHPAVIALVVAYLALFAGYIPYKWLRRRSDGS